MGPNAVDVPIEELRRCLVYCPESGIITWNVRRQAVRLGMIAGRPNSKGHVQVKVGGKLILAHRIAFALMTGEYPTKWVDHINGVRDDNRWVNLRLVDVYQSRANSALSSRNLSGCSGVHWVTSKARWRAVFRHRKLRYYAGSFSTLDEAIQAYRVMAARVLGEYLPVR